MSRGRQPGSDYWAARPLGASEEMLRTQKFLAWTLLGVAGADASLKSLPAERVVLKSNILLMEFRSGTRCFVVSLLRSK